MFPGHTNRRRLDIIFYVVLSNSQCESRRILVAIEAGLVRRKCVKLLLLSEQVDTRILRMFLIKSGLQQWNSETVTINISDHVPILYGQVVLWAAEHRTFTIVWFNSAATRTYLIFVVLLGAISCLPASADCISTLSLLVSLVGLLAWAGHTVHFVKDQESNRGCWWFFQVSLEHVIFVLKKSDSLGLCLYALLFIVWIISDGLIRIMLTKVGGSQWSVHFHLSLNR